MNELLLLAGLVLSRPTNLIASSQQQTDPKITLTVQATTAAKALQQLSSSAQIVLTTSPQTAKDVITFKFKDVPLSDAMKKIADVVDGTWKPEGASFRLIRTSDQLRAERAAELAQDTEQLRKWIAKCVADGKKLPPWNSAEAEQLAAKYEKISKDQAARRKAGQRYLDMEADSKFGDEEPSKRMLTKMATSFNPKDLAGMPGFSRTVWSTNPTRMQLRMPSEFWPLLDQLARDQEEWTEAMNRHHLNGSDAVNVRFAGTSGGNAGDSDNKIAKILLIATRSDLSPGCTFSLIAYDGKGELITQSDLVLGDEFDDEPSKQTDKSESAGSNESKIALDADGRLLISLLNRGSESDSKGEGDSPTCGQHQSPKSEIALSPTLRAKLIRPEEFDPLSFVASPALIQAADIKGVNMVACLNDDILDPGCFDKGDLTSVSSLFEAMQTSKLVYDLKERWLVAKPARPTEAREFRTDRKILARFLNRVNDSRHLSLDERAQFALELPDSEVTDFPGYLANTLVKTSEASFVSEYSSSPREATLCLYGLLTPEQRQRMGQRGLPFSALSDEEMAYINRIVYGVEPNVTIDWNTDESSTSKISQDLMAQYGTALYREPTEALPLGVPPEGLLHIKAENTFVVLPSSESGDEFPDGEMEMGAQGLAYSKYLQDHPDLFPKQMAQLRQIDFNSLNCGPKLDLTFDFQFTNLFKTTQVLTDTNPGAFKKLTLEQLPDDFKKEFNDAYENVKKAFANLKPGQLGNFSRKASPPPPF
jgi:hypothetical protein